MCGCESDAVVRLFGCVCGCVCVGVRVCVCVCVPALVRPL